MTIREVVTKKWIKSQEQAIKQGMQQLKRKKATLNLEKKRSSVQQAEQEVADANKPRQAGAISQRSGT